MKRRIKLWQILLAAVLIFAVGRWLHLQIAYAQIESLTRQHSDELAPELSKYVDDYYNHKDIRFYTAIEYFKVFEYSEANAKVFAVLNSDLGDHMKCPEGNFFYFIRSNGKWAADRSILPDMVWTCGSADGETWPPY